MRSIYVLATVLLLTTASLGVAQERRVAIPRSSGQGGGGSSQGGGGGASQGGSRVQGGGESQGGGGGRVQSGGAAQGGGRIQSGGTRSRAEAAPPRGSQPRTQGGERRGPQGGPQDRGDAPTVIRNGQGPGPGPGSVYERPNPQAERLAVPRAYAAPRYLSGTAVVRPPGVRPVPSPHVYHPYTRYYNYYSYPRYIYSYPRHYYPYGYGAFGLGYFYYDPYRWHPRYSGSIYYESGAGGYDIGELRLDVSPRDAEVWVDGFYAGVVDDFDGAFQSLRLESGAYRIEIVAPGYEPLVFDVRITPGRKTTYRGDLRR